MTSRFIYDEENPVPVAPCLTCRRRYGRSTTCQAFREGIPTEILLGENDHRNPYPGDNGLTYLPKKER